MYYAINTRTAKVSGLSASERASKGKTKRFYGLRCTACPRWLTNCAEREAARASVCVLCVCFHFIL